jgi:hypothetical protein
MTGGICFIIAAVICLLLVKDVGEVNVPISADEEEKLTVQQNAQPVPSSGLIE